MDPKGLMPIGCDAILDNISYFLLTIVAFVGPKSSVGHKARVDSSL